MRFLIAVNSGFSFLERKPNLPITVYRIVTLFLRSYSIYLKLLSFVGKNGSWLINCIRVNALH